MITQVPQAVKDIIGLLGWSTIMGSIATAWVWSIKAGVFAHDRKRAADVAVSQINVMATNHFPHMETGIQDISEKTEKTNELLTELRLGQVETNTILKVVAQSRN